MSNERGPPATQPSLLRLVSSCARSRPTASASLEAHLAHRRSTTTPGRAHARQRAPLAGDQVVALGAHRAVSTDRPTTYTCCTFPSRHTAMRQLLSTLISGSVRHYLADVSYSSALLSQETPRRQPLHPPRKYSLRRKPQHSTFSACSYLAAHATAPSRVHRRPRRFSETSRQGSLADNHQLPTRSVLALAQPPVALRRSTLRATRLTAPSCISEYQ
jgi:hypothetical protein